MSTILVECFKEKISVYKFKEWLKCHNITEEGEILQEIGDLQFRGYDVSLIFNLVEHGDVE